MLTRNKRLRDTMIGIPPREAAGGGSAGRKRSPKLSLFVGFGESAGSDISAKSPRSFCDGAVGLGIVAAMSGAGGRAEASRPERSEPIPIVPARPVARLTRPTRPEEREVEEEEGELSESYTCVISHVGGRPVRRRVYDGEWMDGNGGNYGEELGVFFESPPVEEAARVVAGFLSWCYLCGKKLHGLDIFMYRGEKAFCSVECRCQHILVDEHKEKCRSESVKPLVPSYVDRAPAPLLFCAGVAAA